MAISSTDVVLIVGALSALTPLVKVISQWHIGVKKMSKTEKITTHLQSQISQAETKPILRDRGVDFWIDFTLLLFRVSMMWTGLWMLGVLMKNKEPLTTGSFAMIVMAGCSLIIGFPRDRK